jgi:hypothetical protein
MPEAAPIFNALCQDPKKLQPTWLPPQKQLSPENDAGDPVMFAAAESNNGGGDTALRRKCKRKP